MALQSIIGLSTTSTLEGWEIEDYLGPVSAHVVAGTGFFSDLAAGFSDFFGGRSYAYQHQLQSLNAEAMRMLRLNAGRQQANWVIGMSVDLDEISGKGMQMFMVTATGTAVRARKVGRKPSLADSLVAQSVVDGVGSARIEGRASKEQVRALIKRESLQRSIADGSLVLDDETWSAIVEGGVAEATIFVVHALTRGLRDESDPATSAAISERASAFVSALGESAAIAALYRVVRESQELSRAAIALLCRHSLCDYQAVVDILLLDDVTEKRRILQVLAASPQWYTEQDLSLMAEIVRLCNDPSTFPPYATIVESKGVFSRYEELKCECGSKRPVDTEYCLDFTCFRDRLGFLKREITPSSCARSLEETIRVVRQLL